MGRKGQHAFFGGLLEAHDVGRCYRGCEDRGQQNLDHSDSISSQLNQSKQIPLHPPAIIAAPPLLCFFPPSVPLYSGVYTETLGQSLNLKHTEEKLEAACQTLQTKTDPQKCSQTHKHVQPYLKTHTYAHINTHAALRTF